MSDDAITVVEVQETEYGEKLALESPYDAKDFIKALPFYEYSEYDDYISELHGMDVANAVVDAVTDYEFSDDFGTHRDWYPKALGPDSGAWLIDRESWNEASEFFEFCGFETEVDTATML